MAYTDQYNLSQDTIFRGRVLIAMQTAALQILGEDPGTNHAKTHRRSALATEVLGDPNQHLDAFAFSVVSNAAITAASTDNDIQFQVNSVWDDHAGIRHQMR